MVAPFEKTPKQNLSELVSRTDAELFVGTMGERADRPLREAEVARHLFVAAPPSQQVDHLTFTR